MRAGLSSYTFPWAVGIPGREPAQPLSALDLLRIASELGVGVVQLADNTPLNELDEAAQVAFVAKSQELAPQYRTELLGP